MPTTPQIRLANPNLPIAGYLSADTTTINAVYMDTESHVVQISRQTNGTLQALDLTQQCGTLPAQQSVFAYFSSTTNSPAINYADIDGEVQQLYQQPPIPPATSPSWLSLNQFAQPLQPPPFSRGIGLTCLDPSADEQCIFYVDVYGHIQLIDRNVRLSDSDRVIDLTTTANVPLPDLYHSIPLMATIGLVSGVPEVYYVAGNMHIMRILRTTADSWIGEDITAAANAPVSNGDAFSLVNSPYGYQMVFYTDAQGHIHQLATVSPVPGSWFSVDLTQLTQMPLSRGDNISVYIGQQDSRIRIAYIDQQQHIQLLLSNTGSWDHAIDLSLQAHISPLGPNSTVVAIGSQQVTGSAILYIDAAGHVDALIEGANNWQHSSLV